MCDVRIEHFPIFSSFPLFFRNKALTSDFQRFFPFLLWTVYTRIASSLSGTAAPYSPFFGGPSRMFLVELVDDG